MERVDPGSPCHLTYAEREIASMTHIKLIEIKAAKRDNG